MGKLGNTLFAPKTVDIENQWFMPSEHSSFYANGDDCCSWGTTHFKIVTAAAAVDFENGVLKLNE